MKIALIIPKNSSEGGKSFYDYSFYSGFLMSKRYFSYLLAIPTLASLTPEEHEIRVFDENIEEIDYNWGADLAGISVRTMFAKRAYMIAGKFRAIGVKTVLGGIHPSMCTEEALQHCDSVVVGEAEKVWAAVLDDAKNGVLKRIYTGERVKDLSTNAAPDRRMLNQKLYFSDIIQTTKGCPFHCEFCSVYAYDGTEIRNKNVDQVISEITALGGADALFKRRSIFFADDNIIANRQFARDLFAALKKLDVNWSCQASINISQDEETLKLMKASGCGAILIGLESVSEKNLAGMDKKVNLKYNYIDAIKKIQSHGILVHASFILGYDFDTNESFDELSRFIREANLLMPLINILTPFPGTKLFKRFEETGRILHKDWSKYDGKTIVFKPALLSEEELMAGYKKVLRDVYSFDSIYGKLQSYWDADFWRHSNEIDPIRFKYRLLFALRLSSFLVSGNFKRTKFIMKILPKVFNKKVRISSILTLMAYNDYAFMA